MTNKFLMENSILHKEESKNLVEWIKLYKTQLIKVGLSISALISIVLVVKNKDVIRNLITDLIKSISTTESLNSKYSCLPRTVKNSTTINSFGDSLNNSAVNEIHFNVCRHVRNLPEGMHASPKKISDALLQGIELTQGQTWVVSYEKSLKIA